MARCIICGKSGFFLSVDAGGLCKKCSANFSIRANSHNSLMEGNDIDTDTYIEDYVEETRKKKQAGSVNRKHYTEYVEQVKQLKREKRHKEAIALLLKLIKAIEREAKVDKSYGGDGFCAPGYYEHLAVIYRKEKRYNEEVAVLESLQKQNNYLHDKLLSRLNKARELRDRK